MEDTERDGKKGIYKQRKQTSINYTKLVTKKINKKWERTEKKKKKDDQRKLKILSKTSKYSIRMWENWSLRIDASNKVFEDYKSSLICLVETHLTKEE